MLSIFDWVIWVLSNVTVTVRAKTSMLLGASLDDGVVRGGSADSVVATAEPLTCSQHEIMS